MATANLEPAECECPVCNDYFKQPKLLMCGHDLCRDCLVSLCNSNVKASCPLCRSPIQSFQKNANVPIDDIVNNLPDDLAMAAVVECARILGGKQECNIHSGIAAVSFCLQCNEMLCSTCLDVHKKQKVSRHHVVEHMSSLTPVQLAANRQATCTTHTDRTAELFCSQHHVPLCHVCAIADHRDCPEVEHLEKKGKTIRGDLDQLLTKLNNAELKINETMSKINNHVTELEQNTESVIQEMEEIYKHFLRLAESCLKRHKKCVRDSSSQKKTRILGTKETLTILLGRVISHKVAVKRVQQTVSGSEVFDMTATLTKRLTELDLDTCLPSDLETEVFTQTDPNTVAQFKYELTHLPLISTQDLPQAKSIMISQSDPVLREYLLKTFPEVENRPYFVPTVTIKSLSEDNVTVHRQENLISNHDQVSKTGITGVVKTSSFRANVGRVQERCQQNDMIQQKVLFCLRELAREQKEVMCVLSQLKFSDYPGKHCYLAAAKHFNIPVPDDLDQIHNDGDFDILIIHRYYGLIVGEIRSVTSQTQVVKKSQEQVDEDIASTIEKSIDQLNKSEIVLRHLTKGLDPILSVRKTLIFPNVTRKALTHEFSINCKLEQALGRCLMATDVTQILDLCLLSDNITDHSSPWNVRQLQTWWSSLISVHQNIFMTSEIYQTFVARFIGLSASVAIYSITTPRVQARNEGEDVSVVRKIMAKFPLTYSQVDLLTRNPPRVLLTGGPGVGKSVMLAIKGKQWLRAGQRVHIVITWLRSLAASYMLKHVIQETARLDGITNLADDTVQLQNYDFYNKESDIDNAISTLTAVSGSQVDNIICDEFWIPDSYVSRLQRFVTGLCTRLPNVRLWAASRFRLQKLAELQEEQLNIPLRFPAVVLNEVKKGVNFYKRSVPPYTTTALVTSHDDHNVIHVNHQDSGHTGRWPLECYKCGQCIADILQRLGVGKADLNARHSINNTIVIPTTFDVKTSDTNNRKSSSTPLQYRDVFVLTGGRDLRDDVRDDAGNVTSSANGVVRGLRDAGIPVRVIRYGHVSRDVCDTAVAQSDVVTVACYGHVYGLERKVVVCLPHRNPGEDENLTDEKLEACVRLYAMSLCTSQLVVVDVPLSDTDVTLLKLKEDIST